MYKFLQSLTEAPVVSNRIATSAGTPKVSGPGDSVDFDPNVGKPFIKKQQSSLIPQDILNLAKNREIAVQMNTILGAMYQAKRRNPQVQMTAPMLVTGIKDKKQKDNMMKLFNAGKDKSLAQLAQMSQDIKKVSIPPQGANPAQVSQGGTPTEQQHAQELLDIIKNHGAQMNVDEIQQALKALENASRRNQRRSRSPMLATQQQGAPSAGVINTG